MIQQSQTEEQSMEMRKRKTLALLENMAGNRK